MTLQIANVHINPTGEGKVRLTVELTTEYQNHGDAVMALAAIAPAVGKGVTASARGSDDVLTYLRARWDHDSPDRADQAQNDLETERMRLAACSVAAMCPEQLEGMRPEYDSASRQDVSGLREQYDAAVARVRELETTIAPPEVQAEIAAVVAATPEPAATETQGPTTEAAPDEPLPGNLPATPLNVALLQQVHEGVKVVSVKELPEFTYAKRADGWVIKLDNRTGQELDRKQTAVQTTVAQPKQKQQEAAAAPPATTEKPKPGLDPDATRRAFADQAGVPASVSEPNTLREAIIASVAHLGKNDSSVAEWMIANREHIGGCHGIPADKLGERIERILLALVSGA
jgi:hypothetical protein